MTRLITTNYTATEDDDYYIGVDAQNSVTITLPACADGKQFIIKSQMSPPMAKRKITIVSSDNSKFDGYSDHTLHASHECAWLMRSDGQWRILS